MQKRLLSIGILIACNGRGTPADDPATTHGVAVQHNVTESGVEDQPVDLSTTQLRTHATKTDWLLEIARNGTRTFVAAGALTPDVSEYHFGRGNARRATKPTPVSFAITGLGGLGGWGAGDSLQLVAGNAGLTLAAPENGFTSYPGAGDTTIMGQTVDWSTTLSTMVDATAGDTTMVTQLVAAGSGAARYSALARAGVAWDFTIADGHPATLSVALAPVPQDRKLAVRWAGSQFAALAAEAGPGARPGAAASAAIVTVPATLARNSAFFATYYTGLPQLVAFAPLPASDVDLAVQYGNPFGSPDAAWDELATVIYSNAVPVVTGGASTSLPARLVVAVPVAQLAQAGAIAPAISPVRGAAINGRPLDTAQRGVGTSPTLQWSAPAVGSATNYAVVIHQVEASNVAVAITPVATFYTRGTQLQLPATVLATGATYVATITAIAAPGTDLTARPFAAGLPFAAADHVTALFTP